MAFSLSLSLSNLVFDCVKLHQQTHEDSENSLQCTFLHQLWGQPVLVGRSSLFSRSNHLFDLTAFVFSACHFSVHKFEINVGSVETFR
jgi:hypothetical protein